MASVLTWFKMKRARTTDRPSMVAVDLGPPDDVGILDFDCCNARHSCP